MAGAKESKYFDEAERLYLAGNTLERVAELLPEPVSVGRLSQWSKKGGWPAKRKAAMASLRNVADILQNIVEDKIRDMEAAKSLDATALDAICKATASIERLKRGAYDFRTVAVEVMGRFSEWLVKNAASAEERKLVATLVQNWFREMA